jgi:predicted nucleic acid-binding protein
MVSPLALANKDKIKEILTFEEDFCKVDNGNVYPLLARPMT